MFDNFLTTDQAAQQTGLDAGYITRLLREGKLAGQQVRRVWFVDKASLDAYMGSNRKPGPKGPHKKQEEGEQQEEGALAHAG